MSTTPEALYQQIFARYQEIMSLTQWNRLSSLENPDQVNELVDKRGVLINEIAELRAAFDAQSDSDAFKNHPRYPEIKNIITEILELDGLFTMKIRERLQSIRDELRSRTLFRTQALPCYTKQKLAFSR